MYTQTDRIELEARLGSRHDRELIELEHQHFGSITTLLSSILYYSIDLPAPTPTTLGPRAVLKLFSAS